MTRCLLALVKTTSHSAELKQCGKGGKKKSGPVMKACGGAAKGLRFDHKLVRMTPPGLGLMREEMCGKTIQLKLR